MLLVADVGNTNITLGLYDEEKLISTLRLITKMSKTADEYGREILNLLGANGMKSEDVEAVVVSSVVPGIMDCFNRGVREYLKREPFLIGPHIKTGISIRTDRPHELGADRLVDAAAAYHTYGGPVLIIDFGTATTYDVVTKNGEFLGGAISPGIKICAEALWAAAAKLPKIEIKKPGSILEKNTESSMQAGLVYGYIGQVEYIVKEMKKIQGKAMKVVATGGLSGLFKGNTGAVDIFDEELTLKGLRYLYDKNH